MSVLPLAIFNIGSGGRGGAAHAHESCGGYFISQTPDLDLRVDSLCIGRCGRSCDPKATMATARMTKTGRTMKTKRSRRGRSGVGQRGRGGRRKGWENNDEDEHDHKVEYEGENDEQFKVIPRTTGTQSQRARPLHGGPNKKGTDGNFV